MVALAEAPVSGGSAALQNRYAALGPQLAQGSIQRGIYLESVETSRTSKSDVYAVVDHDFGTIRDAITRPENWCEALLLHLNIKYCHAAVRGERTILSVAVGKNTEQPLSQTYRVEFAYEITASDTDYAEVALDAGKGPLGTKNYHIELEMIPIDGERSFLHLRYSYNYGLLARLAMRAYFATSGYSKVGFTRIGGENGRPSHLIGGLRGAIERNTMRYYLAIDAYLSALATPAPQRFEDSLERWFDATEHHALQLHEVERDAYLAMKRHEYLRQQTVP